MKHKVLAMLMVLTGLSLFVFGHPQHTSAMATGCGQGQICTILIVKLNGNVPKGTTVTAKRQTTIGQDDNFSLVHPTNESAGFYTSGVGIAGTNVGPSNGGSACVDPNSGEGKFQVTASAGGKSLGTVIADMCNNRQNGSYGWAVTVTMSIGSTKLGGIAGTATYNDQAGKNGNCRSGTINLYGGPSNLPEGKVQPTTINSDGSFNSGLILPDGTYTATVRCFSNDASQAQQADGLYTATLPVKIVHGQLVDPKFHNIANSGQGGGINNAPGSSGDPSPTCESSGFSLSWIMCPIINGLASAADGIYSNVIKPLLVTRSINVNDPSDKASQAIFKVWSVFRVFGDIFLAIALIVLVFGESIGGGMIDAYTIKKVLPRILIAAVLINISIYVAIALVDITNVIGGGLIRLITAPFGQSGNFDFTLNGTTSGLGLTALLAGVGALWIGGGALLEFLFAFILLPAIFIVVSVMVVVLLRRGLIILLVMASPIAFALYCLPNTEQYFRKYMDLFIKTLMVYPIVAALFGLAKVLSVTIAWGGETSGLASTFAQVLAIIALFIPLALIPFAFKIAGGFLGRVHELAAGYGKRTHQAMLGSHNDPNSWRNRARAKVGDNWTQARERGVAQGRDSSNPFRRTFSRGLNYGNLQAKRSAYNKQRSTIQQDQIATGDDSNIRDLFIAQAADGQWYRRMDMQRGEDGSLAAIPGAKAVYKDAASGHAAHRKSMSLYGGNKSSVQDALYYEWKKTSFDPDAMNNLVGQYDEILGEHGFNRGEGVEMGKAVGFRHQGQSLASKHSTFGYNESTGQWGMHVNHTSLAKEGGFNIGTYQWSNQDVSTFDELGRGHQQISTVLGTYGNASDDTIISGQTGELAEYNGQSVQNLRDAKRRIEGIAVSTNPDQMMGGRGQQLSRQTHVGEDGTPDAGYGGVSNAPVEVQDAARRLYQQIYGNRQVTPQQQTQQNPPTTPPTRPPITPKRRG